MSQALEKFNPSALAAIIGTEAIEQVNDNFTAGISSGDFLPMISIRGNRFRLRMDGEETALPDRHIEVFLVTSRPNVSKTFYQAGYQPGAENKAPDCSSSDGQYPDANVENPQSTTCGLCPNNAWGSKMGVTGKKSKACADYKLIVLALTAKPDTAFALRVPAASLKPFSAYIKKLQLTGVPANAAKTKIKLGDTEFPSLEFDFVGTVDSKDQYEMIQSLGNSVEVLNAVKIQSRAPAASLPAESTHAAQQPVVVEQPVVVVEPPKPAEPGLADLLSKSKGKKKKADATPEAEMTPVEKVIAQDATPAAPVADEPAGEIVGLDQLLAKMKKK